MATVFISHRGSDGATAAILKKDLDVLGHDVWLDLDEMRPGDSIIQRMNSGLTDATHLLVMYSDDPNPGPWMDREWYSTLARQLDGENVRLIPVRIGQSKGPALLRDIKYANLAANWTAGLTDLQRALS